jgi:hypothetical protein
MGALTIVDALPVLRLSRKAALYWATLSQQAKPHPPRKPQSPKNAMNISQKPGPSDKEKLAPNQAHYKIYLLLGLTLIGIIAAFQFPPISQDPAYHAFADTKTILAIPNCRNVLSNLPFLVIGFAGLVSIGLRKPAGMFPQLTTAYLLFYTGIFLTGIGSSYYHLNSNNATLLWDRLPMTIAFMAFFAIIIGEFISLQAGRKLLLPLLLTGGASVLYWHVTESHGHGDLRFYALVQFLPIILIPVIMLLFRSGTDTNLYTWLVVLAYLIAKIFETFDEQIFETLHFVSGHTIKHLAAALAPLLFLTGLYKRRIKSQPQD